MMNIKRYLVEDTKKCFNGTDAQRESNNEFTGK
jgi:hypothetical protein